MLLGIKMSGFTHTAFAFGYEAGISKRPIDGNMVPPEALVKFVQNGVQYMEMEANLNNVSICIFLLKVHQYIAIIFMS